jgi:hypothetical protein
MQSSDVHETAVHGQHIAQLHADALYKQGEINTFIMAMCKSWCENGMLTACMLQGSHLIACGSTAAAAPISPAD